MVRHWLPFKVEDESNIHDGLGMSVGRSMGVPHLRESWLQGTGASALDKSLDQTKVVKLCCLEIVI